jgi:hypothetical protein
VIRTASTKVILTLTGTMDAEEASARVWLLAWFPPTA